MKRMMKMMKWGKEKKWGWNRSCQSWKNRKRSTEMC